LRGTVKLEKAITLRGELLPKGARQAFAFAGVNGPGAVVSDRSVVLGGYAPIGCAAPSVTIEDLRFDGADMIAIGLITGGSVTIRRNVFTGLRQRQFGPAASVWSAAIYSMPPSRQPGLPGVTGPIVIENNEVSMQAADADFAFARANGKHFAGEAIRLHQSGAAVRIAGNTLRGDFAGRAIYLEGQNGHVRVASNSIEVTHERPSAYPKRETFGGVLVADYTPALPPGHYEIVDNRIVCHAPSGDGILTQFGPRPDPVALTVVRNHIRMNGSTTGGAITIGGMATRAAVAQNRLEGSGLWALALIGHASVAPSHATLRANDITGFSASLADVVFRPGADHNALIGDGGVVADEAPNANNSITGFTRKPAPPR
jgi:hypothetical protein